MKGISPERWSEIDRILDAALELDPAARASFVTESCGDDSDLVKDVMSLLDAAEKSSGFLEKSGKDHLNDMLADMVEQLDDDEENDPYVNKTMGPYRLIRRLGRGGMGQVYLGVRQDKADDRFVAIKIIRRGMDTDEILHRFRVERRILASLTHPNIARLLDGGATDDGLSYFVMDYVDGTSLTAFSDRERLTIDERLALFEQICSAIHYAHQKLIIHRDIKPSNILVTDEREVKLLDFGIAKFLDPGATDADLPMTKTGVRVMTPDYASPEQIRGDRITTVSDVYQLGILLYELLTGSRPYDFTDEARAEIERIILEKEPEKPSTAIKRVKSSDSDSDAELTSTRSAPIDRIRKQLSGDLDRIVLMALRKDPDRRYQSADQFKQDIIAFRTGRPVLAQSDTFVYRTGKFVRRHKGGVAASAIFVLMLITVFVLVVRFAFVTAEQNKEIQQALLKKDQVTELMLGMFGDVDPEMARGREVTARELLDRGVARIELELGDQPDVQAEMLNSIGVVYLQLGLLEKAEPLLFRALEMRRVLYGGEQHADLAQSLFDVARWYEENLDERAEIMHLEAFDMRSRLYERPHMAIAESSHELGVVYLDMMADHERAEGYLQDALDMFMELEGPESRKISEALSNLGVVYSSGDMADLVAAEIVTSRALSMQRQLLGNDHPFVASNLNNLGALAYDLGNYEASQQLLEEAIALRRLLYGDHYAGLANSMNKLSQVLRELGQFDESERLIRDAISIHGENYASLHPRTGHDYHMLGLVLERDNRPVEAEEAFRTAVAILSETVPAGHYLLADAQASLDSLLR
ncbi:MAG: serine/threonine protein kinase [Bacteroidetes bacterium]|nr:MAG: serine/threonine protein kinase [Bacteroidota bacterium]